MHFSDDFENVLKVVFRLIYEFIYLCCKKAISKMLNLLIFIYFKIIITNIHITFLSDLDYTCTR